MSVDEHGHQDLTSPIYDLVGPNRRDVETTTHGAVKIVKVRPSPEFMYLEWAKMASGRSTCKRAKVGALLTDVPMMQVLAYGYNGNARKLPNECDRPNDPGGCGCVHAEANALIKAPGIVPKYLFTSVAPCLACAKLAVNAFVERVCFAAPYRDTGGVAILLAAGVRAFQLDSLGRTVWDSYFNSISELRSPDPIGNAPQS